MKPPILVQLLVALTLPVSLFASTIPTSDDFARCEKITKIVFKKKEDRDPKMLEKYYTPQFRALIVKGSASEDGMAPFLDADFLRLTQDAPPRIAKVGPATAKGGKIRVPVFLRYQGGAECINTAVFEQGGHGWLICDLVSAEQSLRKELEKEFGN